MKGFRVAEVFGPTIQGEGPYAGQPTYFVRFGGCDARCVWCDSMHAVKPELVGKLPIRTPESITLELMNLDQGFEYRRVVFSGGNPAIWDLTELVALLKHKGWEIHVETQGSIWRDWLHKVDAVIVSPKPPSAGPRERDTAQLKRFMDQMGEWWKKERQKFYFKIVIFDDRDLDFALEFADTYLIRDEVLYLSVGTHKFDRADTLLASYKKLIEDATIKFAKSSLQISVLPQMHVLVWGHALGV